MKTLFLTSSPTGEYRSSKPAGFKGFNPANGMVSELKRVWKEDARCLLIAAFPESFSGNDQMRDYFEQVLLDTGLSIAGLELCDDRNADRIVPDLDDYDMIILSGGHVPTELAFFNRIGLPDRIRSFDGIVMGISAGSMNCAEIVYAQPEMPGEGKDPAYRKFLPGLGLTKFNILPHYQAVKDDLVDGLRLMEEITFPDSVGHTFYAIPDGSYLLQHGFSDDARAQIRGQAYRVRDGKIREICRNDEAVELGDSDQLRI